MQVKKILGFASALAILATATPAPHLSAASSRTRVEEKRDILEIATIVLIAAALEGAIIALASLTDTQMRKIFTVMSVDELKARFPDKNIVICNVDYSLSCTPEIKQTVSFKPTVGKRITYDILVFGKGCTFDRKGDGGYQNWAYTAPTGCQIDGGHIAC